MKALPMIVLVLLILLSACGPNMNTYSNPASPIIVTVGDRFGIELPSNATTGYSWEFGSPVDETYLKVVKTYYTTPETTLVGTGGIQGWILEATQSGFTAITLEYKRPWETTEPAAKTTIFNVTIQ
jgi:inhibitor of cysteine peptidase